MGRKHFLAEQQISSSDCTLVSRLHQVCNRKFRSTPSRNVTEKRQDFETSFFTSHKPLKLTRITARASSPRRCVPEGCAPNKDDSTEDSFSSSSLSIAKSWAICYHKNKRVQLCSGRSQSLFSLGKTESNGLLVRRPW